jgi:cell division protein FtsI (penicillin-binding protein 3)
MATGVPLPGESDGSLNEPARWSGQSAASVVMGYELAVTPLQLVSAYATLANGGELLQPHIIKEIRSTDGAVLYEAKRRVLRKVFSERVSNQVRELLRSVVDSGTAVKADLAAFEVAGKSGTARRTEKGRGYVAGNYTASFVGLFPAEKPQYVVLVKLDSPKRSYFGGEVAAPVTSVVLRAALAARNAALDRGELASVEQDVPLAPSESTATAVMPGDTSATITGQAVLAPVAEPLAGPPKIFLLPYEKRRAVVDKSLRPVPDVRGLPVRSAVRALHRAGFRVTLATTIGVPTLPVAGTLLAPGSIVKLQHIP